MRKQLLTSSAFRLIERVVVILTSLLLTPYLINVLGEKDYGLWILILSILGWFNVIDLGFPSAVQRHITLALAKKDDKAVNIVFSTSIALFGGLGVFAATCLLMVIQFPHVLGVDGADGVTFTLALTVLAIKIIWDFVMNAFHGFFSGLLRFEIDANISSLNSVLKALLVFYLLPELHIWGAVIATLATDVLTNILKVVYAKKLFKPLHFGWKLVSIKEIKSLFLYSKHVIAAGIAQTINTKIDPILVTKLFDLPSVAMYNIAMRLASHVKAFSTSINGVFGPVFTQMVAKGKDMEDMFEQVTSINFFVATALFLPLIIFGELFITLWVGDKFAYAIYIVYFIVFSFLCRTVSGGVRNILLAQANHKLLSVINLIGAIFNVILSVVFAKYWGLIGVAAGTALGFFVSDVILSLVLLRRYNDYSLFAIVKGFIVTTLLTYNVGILGHYLVSQYIEISWLSLLLYASLSFPFIVIMAWFFVLNKGMKAKTLDIVISKVMRKKAT